MPLLALGDEELEIVLRAAQPLQARQRAAFLQELAEALQKHDGEIGPGLVSRIARQTQQKFFDPPIFTGNLHTGKYGRR